MDWTDELEKSLRYIGDCSRGYVWMYKRDMQRYTQIYTIINNVSICAGVISGALGALSLGLGVEQHQGMIVTSVILTFITSITQGYISNAGYETSITNLKRQAAKYSGLINNIRRQLGLPRQKRERAGDYQRWIAKSFEDLSEASLDISDTVMEEYRKIAKEANLPFPDDTGIDSNIIIHAAHEHEAREHEAREAREHEPRVVRVNAESTEEKRIDIPSKPLEITPVATKAFEEKGEKQTILQEALKYSDAQMQYELARLNNT